ncbi:sensor histidine kinase [Pseudonocardia sp. CA-107938]|uniref:sensor histidine kinase n=1 Tax=Pseudonocardia sp. CA-107938 TaxID=3240021 RepID=UPI003D8D488F
MSRFGALTDWWAHRSLRTRITLVVGIVALVALTALSRLGGSLLVTTVVSAADVELEAKAESVAESVRAGVDPAEVRIAGVRVVDVAGRPVDGGAALPLSDAQVRRIAGGEALSTGDATDLRRWLGRSTVGPDGVVRIVVATADLVGSSTILANAAGWFLVGALLAACVVALAAWSATRAALRPVDRLRAAAAGLPPGARLPVPPADDELRALAEEINLLLARRDDAAARLERFTGDAAHELRSPVAAIRAQAEVAVAHPDPALTGETLQSIADEAARLSSLLSALLALTRADSGQRPPAQPVDLVAAARSAIDRASSSAAEDAPALTLAAPTPAVVAATASEVALVLDNLIGNASRHAATVVRVGVLPAGRWVRLVVEDDGKGIAPADRRRVFDRFVRLNPEAGGGAGLGLALVAALVHGRGGTVSAGEAGSGGARFEVRWPSP